MGRFFQQMARGCCDLPHVGPHPGLGILGIFVGIAAVAGSLDNGVLGAIVGSAFMLCGLGPFVLAGAYSRAKLSDRLSAKEPVDDQHPIHR